MARRSSITPVTSTPSPKSRKIPHCKTCGSPMRGHRKAECAQGSPNMADKTDKLSSEDEIVTGVEKLAIVDSVAQQKPRRRSSQVHRQPSLESLSSSTSEILTRLATPVKQELNTSSDDDQKDANFLLPTSLMPDILLKKGRSEDAPELTRPAGAPEPDSPSNTSLVIKKRKSVRVSLPGANRTSLRIQRAQKLESAEASGVLRAMFFKTTAQQATLFKMTSGDAEEMVTAATQLGLQSHYFHRGRPQAIPGGDVKDSIDEDVDWLIIGKNEAAIDEMIKSMENEAQPEDSSSETKGKVKKHFLAQVTAAGLAGAAVMWAGLAFA